MCETNPATSYRISRIHLQHPVVSIRNHIPPIIPAFYSRKLFTLACPIHLLFFSSHLFPRAGSGWNCFTVRFIAGRPTVLFQQIANAAFDVPSVHMEGSWCSKQMELLLHFAIVWLNLWHGSKKCLVSLWKGVWYNRRSWIELMVRKNWFSNLPRICYACGRARGRFPTESDGSRCRFKSGNFIVKNYGHGDVHLYICVWTTRLRGTWGEECCSQQATMSWNNHIWTTLRTCWKRTTFFPEISAGRWTGRCWRKRCGVWTSWGLQSGEWRTNEQGMIQGWLQNCWSMRRKGFRKFSWMILDVFRHAVRTGQIPTSWQTTIFKMFLKSSGAKLASDFRPIGRLRLLYNIFAYPLLGRMEDTLQDSQPGEQHSFRKQRAIEEHLLTANLCCRQNWRQTSSCGSLVWMFWAFDNENWEALWAAFGSRLAPGANSCWNE